MKAYDLIAYAASNMEAYKQQHSGRAYSIQVCIALLADALMNENEGMVSIREARLADKIQEIIKG